MIVRFQFWQLSATCGLALWWLQFNRHALQFCDVSHQTIMPFKPDICHQHQKQKIYQACGELDYTCCACGDKFCHASLTNWKLYIFVESFYNIIGLRCTWGQIFGSTSLSLTELPFGNLTDVTLADKDTKSILTDNANRAIQANAMWECMWLNLMGKYVSGAIWWSNLQPMHLLPFSGQIWNWWKCPHLV